MARIRFFSTLLTKVGPPRVTLELGDVIRGAGMVWIALCCYGCSPGTVDSSQVATGGTFVTATLRSEGTGVVTANVQLRSGSGAGDPYVRLSAGDRLLISNGVTSTDWQASGSLFDSAQRLSNRVTLLAEHDRVLWNIGYLLTQSGEPEYVGLLSGVGGNNTVLFNYLRPQHTSITDLSVTLPAPFAITAPSAGTTHSRAGPITLTWSNGSADTMRVKVGGICNGSGGNNPLQAEKLLAGDTGSATLATADFFTTPAFGANDTCDLTIALERSVATSLTGLAAGSFVEAVQARAVHITSVP